MARNLSADPNFSTSIENYKGDKHFRKDIRNALFFISRDSTENESFQKLMEQYYYPENTKKERRRTRVLYGSIAGVFGSLVLSIGVLYNKINKDFEKQEKAEKNWEKTNRHSK